MARNNSATSPGCAGRVAFVARSKTGQPASSRSRSRRARHRASIIRRSWRGPLRRRRLALADGLVRVLRREGRPEELDRRLAGVLVAGSAGGGGRRPDDSPMSPGRAGSRSRKQSPNSALTKWMMPGTLRKFSVRLSRPVRRELGPPLAEDRRLGAAEPVDRLLHVADHEQPAREERLAAQQPEDLALDAVGILELVDQDEFDRPGRRRTSSVGGHDLRVVAEQVAGQDQEVVEIEPAASPLEPLVLAPDRQREPGEPQALVGRREQRIRVVPIERRLGPAS